MTVLRPAVAGTFYPAYPDALATLVDDLLSKVPALDVPAPKAVILPHAGYRFSGGVAASAVTALTSAPQRVVILGPSHHHAFNGIAVPAANAMATPLGDVPIDRFAIEELLKNPDVNVVPEAFSKEHSIEVELPFLQRRCGTFGIVPLIVGQIEQDRLAEIVDTLWGGEKTLIVISTDLTHFLNADEAERIDTATAQSVEKIEGARLGGREACGHRPLMAFLKVAEHRGLRLTRTALTHSGKITGDTNRVVGYGAWIGHDAGDASLSSAHRKAALTIARQTLNSRVKRGKAPEINLASFPHPLQGVAPAFVTLTQDGRLRGCIGSLKAHQPLARDILTNTVKAGFQDPRFKPVTPAEADALEIEIAVLSHPAPMQFDDQADLKGQLRPGRDGLILQSQGKRGTFLPKVWDHLETPDKFFDGLKVKAGLPRDHWADDVQVWRYVAEAFAE